MANYKQKNTARVFFINNRSHSVNTGLCAQSDERPIEVAGLVYYQCRLCAVRTSTSRNGAYVGCPAVARARFMARACAPPRW